MSSPSAPHSGRQDRDRIIGRALRLLEILCSATEPLTLGVLTAAVDLPRTSVYRLLQTMHEFGLVDHDADGYVVGPRARSLIDAALAVRLGLARTVMPFMVDLHGETGQIVRLGVLERYECVYIETVCGSGTVANLGHDRVPAHACAAGKMLMAYRDDPIASIPLERPLLRLTDFTVIDPVRLADELVAARLAGVAVALHEQRLGMLAVARPVLLDDRQPIAAIEVVGNVATLVLGQVAPFHQHAVAAASIAVRADSMARGQAR